LICAYAYCRAILPPGDRCPRCGHPVEVERLRDPAFFAEGLGSLGDLPARKLDLHQILPEHPRILMYQTLAMDALGVERALLQSAPAAATSLRGNDGIAAAVAEFPTRFWGSTFVDPQSPSALADLDAVRTRVVKLLPVTGWRADDPGLRPFWARMQERGLVAMVHTGFFTARHREEEEKAGVFMRSDLANPLWWDEPCRRFPGLVVILCHLGGAIFIEEAGEMVSQHPNVYGDVAASGVFALRRLLAGGSVDWTKIFWGNDGPPFTYPLNLRLLRRTLADAGADALLGPLLYDHGARFAERHLD
jgi:predicted TIM-barrel fold metal-dependent hydrolase